MTILYSKPVSHKRVTNISNCYNESQFYRSQSSLAYSLTKFAHEGQSAYSMTMTMKTILLSIKTVCSVYIMEI